MDSNEFPPASSAPPPFSSPPPPPPPPLSPPPMRLPPLQSPPRRGRGWMILALVLLVLLGFSLLGNFSQFISGLMPSSTSRSRFAGPRLDETIFQDNDASSKIAVIDIDGVITSNPIDQAGYTMVDVIKAQLERAADDSKVKAVILRVDSPGGEVLASDDIYRALVKFQNDSDKPVVASMGSLAASGGYYVSAASRWIVANELTLTGSIGVILSTWNYRNLMTKVGLQPEVYKSGKFKDMLSGQRDPNEIPAEEREMVQALIDQTYARFKEVVADGRARAHDLNDEEGKALSADWRDYADGRILSGTQAQELGFVDELGDFQDAVDRAKELAGISKDANLIRYLLRHDFSDFLSLFGKSEARSIKLDLGLEMPKIEAGRPYFLSPTFLH